MLAISFLADNFGELGDVGWLWTGSSWTSRILGFSLRAVSVGIGAIMIAANEMCEQCLRQGGNVVYDQTKGGWSGGLKDYKATSPGARRKVRVGDRHTKVPAVWKKIIHWLSAQEDLFLN